MRLYSVASIVVVVISLLFFCPSFGSTPEFIDETVRYEATRLVAGRIENHAGTDVNADLSTLKAAETTNNAAGSVIFTILWDCWSLAPATAEEMAALR